LSKEGLARVGAHIAACCEALSICSAEGGMLT
jgi:hypothetical protein